MRGLSACATMQLRSLLAGKIWRENVYVNNEKRHKNGYEKTTLPFDSSNTIIGDKIVETLYSNRVTSENKRIHTHPCPLHSNLGCLLLSTGRSNSGTTLHGEDKGGKAILPLLKSVSLLILSPIVGCQRLGRVCTGDFIV